MKWAIPGKGLITRCHILPNEMRLVSQDEASAWTLGNNEWLRRHLEKFHLSRGYHGFARLAGPEMRRIAGMIGRGKQTHRQKPPLLGSPLHRSLWLCSSPASARFIRRGRKGANASRAAGVT